MINSNDIDIDRYPNLAYLDDDSRLADDTDLARLDALLETIESTLIDLHAMLDYDLLHTTIGSIFDNARDLLDD
jgi:hypothetical protein